MRSFNYCRVLLFVVCLLISGLSPASSTLYWKQPAISAQQFSSASAACAAAVAYLASTGSINSTAYPIVGPISGTPSTGYAAYCRYNGTKANGDPLCSTQCAGLSNVTTFGQCNSPDTFDPSTGECNPPEPPPDENPCAAKTGTGSPFSKSGSGGDGYYSFSGGYGAPAQSGCFDTCTASTVDQKCTGNLKTNTYKCRGTMYYTGAQCTTSPAPEVDETTDTSRPEPQTYKDQTPCNYTAGPTGSQVCTSSSTEGKEGQYCGTVNGVKTCIDSKPTQNGIEINTKVETTTNSDGSTTTTKTDTANSTKCTGHNQCTSSSTTTTTTTTKDGNGNTTSVTGSCTGAQCPDKNTNPDGDGDGFGDCVGDDCSDGGGAGVTAPELEEVPGYGDSLQAYFDEIQDAPIVAAVTAISLPSGGSCPTYSATIEYVGTVSTATACDLASNLLTPLHYLFLAIWAFVAVRTTMTA